MCRKKLNARAHLGVPNEHELRLRALGVERVHGGRDGCDALHGGGRVGDVAARRLPSAGGVVDRLGRGAGVRAKHEVDDDAGGTVSWWRGRLARAEDVDARAALALLDLGVCEGLERKEQEGGGEEAAEHFVLFCGVGFLRDVELEV